jgi:hypothetical protein
MAEGVQEEIHQKDTTRRKAVSVSLDNLLATGLTREVAEATGGDRKFGNKPEHNYRRGSLKRRPCFDRTYWRFNNTPLTRKKCRERRNNKKQRA